MILYRYFIKNICLFISFLLLISMFSCVPHKSLLYMTNKPSKDIKETFTVPVYTYIIAKGDILGIDISTFTKGGINSISENVTKQTTGGSDSPTKNGYVINPNGMVNLPMMGDIILEGLTLEQARELISKKASEYINNPIIKVSLLSFYITVLGEVGKVGRLQITSTSINIYEALALAGDLQITAKQSKVRVVRINQDQATTYYLDMNSADIFKSEVFYLKPGDMIYVEPTKAKVTNANLNVVNIFTTILTTLLFVTNMLVITKVIN